MNVVQVVPPTLSDRAHTRQSPFANISCQSKLLAGAKRADGKRKMDFASQIAGMATVRGEKQAAASFPVKVRKQPGRGGRGAGGGGRGQPGGVAGTALWKIRMPSRSWQHSNNKQHVHTRSLFTMRCCLSLCAFISIPCAVSFLARRCLSSETTHPPLLFIIPFFFSDKRAHLTQRARSSARPRTRTLPGRPATRSAATAAAAQ